MLGKCCVLQGFLKIDQNGYGFGLNVRDAGYAGRGDCVIDDRGDTALLRSWVCSSRQTDRDKQFTSCDRPTETDN